MRRLLHEFIVSLRERPFSYKIAYCQEVRGVRVEPDRLRALYDGTDYVMGRVVLSDTIRRLELDVSSTFLRHIVATGNRYMIKSILLTLCRRESLRTLVRVAKHPICQDDSLIRHLIIKAARAQEVDPNQLEMYFNTEEAEFTDEETQAWRLWRPLDELIEAVNQDPRAEPDTLRLMLFENRPLLAEELARDLSDVFNIGPGEIPMLTRRRLVMLLAKYIDLTYLTCHALAEDNFGPLEERLEAEDDTMPKGVLLPPGESSPLSRPQSLFPPSARRAPEEEDEEIFPEEGLFSDEETVGDTTSPPTPEAEEIAQVDVDDLIFEPEWQHWIPRSLAEELLIFPLDIDGDPPRRIHVGCGRGDHATVRARLQRLGCYVVCTTLPKDVVREAIRRHYV